MVGDDWTLKSVFRPASKSGSKPFLCGTGLRRLRSPGNKVAATTWVFDSLGRLALKVLDHREMSGATLLNNSAWHMKNENLMTPSPRTSRRRERFDRRCGMR